MRLPAMKYLDGNRKKTQVKFGGLNSTAGARDGELRDMKNLTGDLYPVLSTRVPMTKVKDLDVAGGIFHWNHLCWIDAGDFYYNGEVKGCVEEQNHTLAAIGPYIVIFPERFYYDTVDDVFGDLQSCWNGIQLTFAHVDADGLWDSHDVIKSEDTDWNDYFQEGDAVTISGCARQKNNITAVIRHVDRNNLIFDRDIFNIEEGNEYTEQGEHEAALEIMRSVPDLTCVCENDNRLWGASGNRIFASMPGNPFRWFNRDGSEMDGWDVDTGSMGEFTGCISYQGQPLFFKEDRIYKVYGSIPSQYQVVDTVANGVMTNCEGSLAIADGVLFYLSRSGVMAYSGGVPQSIAEAFGQQKFDCGVAGSDGRKYYISMRSEGQFGLYVYDVSKGLWFKEENAEARGFAFHAGTLYVQTSDKLYAIGDPIEAERIIRDVDPVPEGPVEWFAEFADFTEGDPDKKGIGKIQIRLELDEGAIVQMWMMFDSDGQWLRVGEATGKSEKRSRILPIVPRRADHYRLKLTGTGGCRIYSMTLESYSGSELKSKEGRQ